MPNQNRINAKNCDRLFRSLYENIFEAVILTRSDGTIISANPAACEIFGMSEKELQNAKRDEMIRVDERFTKSIINREKTGKLRTELTLKRKDGSKFEAEVATSVFTDTDGIEKATMIIRDITERKKAEKTLRCSEERYKSLFEQAADYILVLELPRAGIPIIRDANEAALKKHGYTREEFINQSIGLIDKRIDTAQTKWIIDNVSDGKVLVFEVEHYRKDGTFFNAEVAVKAVKLGSETWILSVERDITERKKADAALHSAIERLHLAQTAAKSGTWEWNLLTGENVWSDETWRLYGLIPSSRKASYELWLETIHPDDKERTVQAVSKAAQDKTELYIEYRLSDSHANGRWLMSRGQPQKNTAGIVDRYLGVIIDITERKKAEEALKASETKLRLLADNMRDVVWIMNLEGRFTFVSPSIFQLRGYTAEEVQNQTLAEAVTSDSLNKVNEVFDQFKQNGETPTKYLEIEQNCKDGSTVWTEVNFTIVRDEKGEPQQIVGVSRDITQRRKTQEELVAAEIKYRTIFEQAGDYILILEVSRDKLPVIYDANDYALQIHGYTREEIIGKPITFLDRSMNQKEMEEHSSQLLQGQKVSFETEHFRKDGTKFTVDVINKLVKIGNKQFIIAIERDITERKKLEQQLKISSNIFDLATDSIIVVDLDGNLVSFNEATYKQRGYSKEEMAKLTLHDLEETGSAENVMQRINELIEKGSLVFEEVEVRKDKSKMPVEVHARVIDLNRKKFILGVIRDISERKKIEEKLLQSDMIFENTLDMICIAGFDGYFKVLNPSWSRTLGWNTEELLTKPWIEFVHPSDKKTTVEAKAVLVNGEKVFQFENRYSCKDGSFKWLSWNSVPLEKEKRIFAVARDITDKKEAENRIAAANEKLRVTGSLTRHDVRNKLSVIKSNVYLLKKHLGNNPELKNFLQDIDNAVDASNKLFEFSSVYEKIGSEKRSEIDIGEYFWQAADLLRNPTIKIVNECKGLVVTADTLVRQLFYNLLDNSAKHGKTVTEARLSFTKKGNGIELIYQDNGVGITKENKVKLFTEGFTTGNGSGLGLMLAKKMVEAYGWSITETGEGGKGAKFVISIPKIKP
jgi:PAS domain S-box-containing protein